MTLFEYVLRKYIGPPRGNSWSCPRHADKSPSMVMRPPRDNHKCRCRCYSCGFWGDIFDVLKLFHPFASFPELQLTLRDLEHELTALQGHDGTSFPQGIPNVILEAGNVWADYRDDDGFELLPGIAARCQAAGIAVEDVVEYGRSLQNWTEESDKRHLHECNDPECDARICRNARGLSPLTPDEIERDRKAVALAKKQQQTRVRHAMRNVKKGNQ